jgi:hypothetical protein
LGEVDDFPGEFIFDSLEGLKVEALPDASELPIVPICELFQNLAKWEGRRIAVKSTMERSWVIKTTRGDPR